MVRVVSEAEFNERIRQVLAECDLDAIGSVTGPGRSGAVAAVYASHILGVPFIPFGAKAPADLGDLLIIDTAEQTGKTMRKALAKYKHVIPTIGISVYKEPPRVAFWYEAEKPQAYRHERRLAA